MALYFEVCRTIHSGDEHCNGRTIEDNFRELLKDKKCRGEDLDILEEILKGAIITDSSCNFWHMIMLTNETVRCNENCEGRLIEDDLKKLLRSKLIDKDLDRLEHILMSDLIIDRICNFYHLGILTHEVVLSNDEVVISRLLQEGTLLHAAVHSQCISLVEKVVEMLPKINEKKNYFDAVHIAASKMFPFITIVLLKDGADVNSVDEYGRTPLFCAVKYNRAEQSKWLLMYGANANNTGSSNLYHAIFPRTDEFSFKIFRLLVENGFDPNTKGDDEGKTMLHGIAENSELIHSKAVAKLLIEYGADINAKTKKGDSVLHIAANKCISAAFLIYLIDSRVDLNVRNAKNETFLDILRQKEDLNTRQNIIVDLMRYLLLEQAKRNFEYDFEKMKMTDRERLEYLLCKEELDDLKKIKLNSQLPFTLYHILIWNKYRMTKLRVDPGLDTDEISQFRTKYPKYGELLKLKYDDGLRRLKAENYGREIFKDILGAKLDSNIVGELVEYFPTAFLFYLDNELN